MAHPEPPGNRVKEPRPKPKIGSYLERIAQIIEEDKAFPKKFWIFYAVKKSIRASLIPNHKLDISATVTVSQSIYITIYKKTSSSSQEKGVEIKTIILQLVILLPVIASEEELIFDQNWNLEYRVEDGRIYEKSWQLKGFLRDGKNYDNKWQLNGRIE
jgi:hypothetical protein